MKTSKAKLTLIATEKDAESEFPQKTGRIIGAFVTVADASLLPKDIVTATLQGQDEKPIVALDVREWFRRSGGSFMSSMLPLNLEAENQVLTFTIITKTAPATNVVMEMVLVHEEITCTNA